MPQAPRDLGTVTRIVIRLGGGAHQTLDKGTLTVAQGLAGDRWHTGKKPDRGRQITLMNSAIAEFVAPSASASQPGDNFLVDLDLSADALPTGTQLGFGNAILEVTDKPHNGCKKFAARFGEAALNWVNAPEYAHRRLRGINCRVVQDGVVHNGDSIRVTRKRST